MKRKLLSAAITSAIAAGPAVAFDPTLTPPEYVITWSGATAPTDTLGDVLAYEICDTDIDRFRHGTHYSIACIVRNNANRQSGAAPAGVSIAGLPAVGRRVLFHKNDGGSGTGAGAVQKAISQGATVTVSGPTARAACTSSTNVALPKPHISNTGCPDNLTPMQSDMGISDVEPTIFVGDLAPPASEGGAYEPNGPLLRVKNVSGLGFGVNVTLAMYRALQNVQFALGDDCNPEPVNPAADTMSASNNLVANPTGLVAGADGYNDAYQALASDTASQPPPKAGGPHRKGDTRACMPNLSRHEVNQVLVGNVPTLLELVDSSTGLDLFTSQLGKPWGPADPLLNICRRRTGSGTHAQTSMFFLRTQCGSDSQVMVDAPLLAGQLFINESSGNLDRCLNAMDTGAAYNLSVPAVPAGPANRYALGYQSVEKNSDFSGSYRFVKIDGRATTLVEMHAGNALNFGEVTTQIRDAENYVDPDIAANGETGAVTDIWESVAARLTDPAGVTTLNSLAKFRHAWGDAGFLIDPDPFGSTGPARTPDVTFNAANPVGTFVHAYPGQPQNSCLNPQKGVPGVTPMPIDL